MLELIEGEAFSTLVLDNDVRDYLHFRRGSGSTIEIFDIQVASERGKGKGRQLITYLVKLAPSMHSLWSLSPKVTLIWALTRADNVIAQQFYEAVGFRLMGILTSFYGVAEDAMMYGREIKE